MKNKLLFILFFVCKISFSQDLVSDGSNKWILHTPDDGRTTLFVAPWVNNDWAWWFSTQFLNNGDVNFSGTITTSGKLGIGTTTPIRKLDVAGITRTTLAEFYEDNVTYGFIGRGSTYTGGWAAIPDALTITYDKRDFAIGGWAKDKSGWKGASLFINSDNSNIGIGTVTPQANLHIGKQEASANTAGQTTRLILQPYGHTGGPWNFICRDIPGVAFLDIYYGTSQAITINSSSNVGIGTSSPQNKLDVNGTIHAREVKVDLTGWSDFVFHPTFKLKSLTEVEQYIQTNGHLENIPSAKEVEQNGVNVGDMQAKLLQKVEELTLYVIELKKENEEIKKELGKLKKTSK